MGGGPGAGDGVGAAPGSCVVVVVVVVVGVGAVGKSVQYLGSMQASQSPVAGPCFLGS